jgi:hypothetical protein
LSHNQSVIDWAVHNRHGLPRIRRRRVRDFVKPIFLKFIDGTVPIADPDPAMRKRQGKWGVGISTVRSVSKDLVEKFFWLTHAIGCAKACHFVYGASDKTGSGRIQVSP